MTHTAHRRAELMFLVAAVASLGLAALVTFDGLWLMVRWWEREEYSHAYFIPVIAVAMFAQRLAILSSHPPNYRWVGFCIVLIALLVAVVGELSAVYTVVQYAFWLLLVGLICAVMGLRATWFVWPALVYLLFAVPLPNFLYNNLSQWLQLVSSELGVYVIRWMGISVYLEGNVIDLGAYKLQVVEACAGLRYLFPLMSFGFLLAYLFRAPWWQRVLLFLSTVPITVLMNSFRIGVIGVLVEHWGIGMADGFLHYFEGWIVFLACLAVLAFEMWIFHRLFGGRGALVDRLEIEFPFKEAGQRLRSFAGGKGAALICCLGLLVVTAAGTSGIAEREENVPDAPSLVRFPLLLDAWVGRESPLQSNVVEALKVSDYLVADYVHPEHRLPVNLYIAYYGSQRKGASVHSPRACIPGGGWVIEQLERVSVDPHPEASGDEQFVQRVVIRQGSVQQLVYYWFEQRGRRLTNEYLVKWYLFWDSLMLNRTDGALVRLVVPVPEGVPLAEADRALSRFVGSFQPLIRRFVPQ